MSLSYEAAAGGLLGALLRVRPPGPGTCQICCSATQSGRATCWNCHTLRSQLSRLTEVLPISLTTKDHQLYDRLKTYKSPAPGRARRELAGLLGLFLDQHRPCVGDFDLITWVPSTSGRHPEGHPLGAVISAVVALQPRAAEVLTRGPGVLDRSTARDDSFVCTERVARRRVVLVDDTYVTGAHQQAAAAALWEADAAHVTAVAFARLIVPGFSAEAGALMEWAREPENRWDPSTCARCAASQPQLPF